MPYYEFDCSECEISWDVKGDANKPPKRRKCPNCGKYRPRVYTPAYIHFIGEGWYVTQERAERFNKDGMAKEDADRFLKQSIEASKKRMESGNEHYKDMGISPEALASHGYKVRVVSAKEAKEKAKRAEQITKDAKRLLREKK